MGRKTTAPVMYDIEGLPKNPFEKLCLFFSRHRLFSCCCCCCFLGGCLFFVVVFSLFLLLLLLLPATASVLFRNRIHFLIPETVAVFICKILCLSYTWHVVVARSNSSFVFLISRVWVQVPVLTLLALSIPSDGT